jgi:hypothetical protein
LVCWHSPDHIRNEPLHPIDLALGLENAQSPEAVRLDWKIGRPKGVLERKKPSQVTGATYEAEIASQVTLSEAANSRRLDLSGKVFVELTGADISAVIFSNSVQGRFPRRSPLPFRTAGSDRPRACSG